MTATGGRANSPRTKVDFKFLRLPGQTYRRGFSPTNMLPMSTALQILELVEGFMHA